jgi:hypothetical protein
MRVELGDERVGGARAGGGEDAPMRIVGGRALGR